MLKMKHLLSALFVATCVASPALADDVAPQNENSAQVQAVTQEEAVKDAVVFADSVNINTAEASELQKMLSGIGAKKAQAIVEYREKHGAFTAPEQLMEVKGIGSATFEKNKDRIRI